MIANIASDDALILPHRANPAGLNFRERQQVYQTEQAYSITSSARASTDGGTVRPSGFGSGPLRPLPQSRLANLAALCIK
jgi:hypothetical protein